MNWFQAEDMSLLNVWEICIQIQLKKPHIIHQYIPNSLQHGNLQYSYNIVYKKENTAPKWEGYVLLTRCTIRLPLHEEL